MGCRCQMLLETEAHSASHDDHPIYEAHEELCPGMMDKTRNFRNEFQLETLHFDAEVSPLPAQKPMMLPSNNTD